MSKKRVTRSSNKSEHQHLLEYEFNQDQKHDQTRRQLNSQEKGIKIEKKLKSRSQTQQIKIGEGICSQDQRNANVESMQNSNPIASKGMNMKKKKVGKTEQNEGLKIIKQKQTQNIFKHFCTPEGVITVNSLGSVLARAKKQFQIQDIQNMIAYFDTIGKLMSQGGNQQQQKQQQQKQRRMRNKQNEQKVQQMVPKREIQKQSKLKKDSQESINEGSESDQQRSIDEQMQMQIDQQQNYKRQLNYEQFKLLLRYFDKE